MLLDKSTGIIGMIIGNPESTMSPYYSKTAFSLFTPIAVLYSLVAQSYFGILVKTRWGLTATVPRMSSSSLPLSTIQGGTRSRRPVAIVTGSNTGIGFETALALAQRGYKVVLACRSRDRTQEALDRINRAVRESNPNDKHDNLAIFLPLDLTSPESIAAFVESVKEQFDECGIDVLVNNAGRNSSGDSITVDNGRGEVNKVELLFQTNFLGSYQLTSLLMPLLQKAATAKSSSTGKGQARIVNLSSVMHHFHDSRLDLTSSDTWKQISRSYMLDSYSLTKLAALLFTIELNKRYKKDGVISIVVNPGAVNSDIWRGYPRILIALFKLVYLTCKQGCVPSVAAATVDFASSMDKDEKTDEPLYLQPYFIPQSDPNGQRKSHVPVVEMLGPYVGYQITRPRLPADGGVAAASALWSACQDLTPCAWPA